MIRVCPERDAACPFGDDCPHSIDRYTCKPMTDEEMEAEVRAGMKPMRTKPLKLFRQPQPKVT